MLYLLIIDEPMRGQLITSFNPPFVLCSFALALFSQARISSISHGAFGSFVSKEDVCNPSNASSIHGTSCNIANLVSFFLSHKVTKLIICDTSVAISGNSSSALLSTRTSQ